MGKDKAKRKYYEYLFNQYKKGSKLSQDKLEILRREGYIDKVNKTIEKDYEIDKETLKGMDVKSKGSWEKGMCPFYFNEWRYAKMKPVTKDKWMPESVLEHSNEFIKWINSMVYGYFPNKIHYVPFDHYKAQAWQWLQEGDNITDYKTPEAKRNFIHREYDRCSENTFYFANRYGELKEGDIEEGKVKYKAKEHHAVLMYLIDCGYSILAGKGRQIGFTSAMGLAADKNLIFKPNYYIKFVTEDVDTGEEIFTDKIKYPYTAFPSWMKPKVRSDSGRRFWLSNKRKKGEQGYPNSRVDVVAPRKTAINGGSPQLVLVDEIANIGILSAMLNEARPTMFWNNPKTGKFELKRQLVMWSSAGSMDKGQGAFEREWYRILSLWESHKHEESGIVPLFFSWHCRCSKEEYIKQKDWYYGGRALEKDIDLETSKTQFHQHYPSTYKDMFLTTANTLVSREIIEKGIERCRNLDPMVKPIPGYFEPIYDFSKPMNPESDTPYKIIGAEFVPVDDEDIKKATSLMFQKPESGWKWRYWQGTDPIATETGHSKMASVIWDDYYKTISCLMNYREQHNHKYVFLQVLLMGLYYDLSSTKEGVKELVESNIGTNYTDYKQSKGYFNSLVGSAQLPTKLLGGSREVGVDSKGNRTYAIIEYMTELFRTYHDRIYIRTFFDQLLTFTQKQTSSGKEVWGAINKFSHYDDALYAAAFAYIARMCYEHVAPTQASLNPVKYKVEYVLTRNADGTLTRVPKKKPVYDYTISEQDVPENIF